MEDGDGLKFRNKEFSGVIDRFCMLIGVMITLVNFFYQVLTYLYASFILKDKLKNTTKIDRTLLFKSKQHSFSDLK